jgi:WD40 repeat protein
MALAVGERSVVAVDWNGTVQLWDRLSGQPRGAVTVGEGGWVSAVAVSPDAERVAVASDDGAVRILPTDPEVWKDGACRSVSRNLTQAEWQASLEGPYEPTCENHPDGPAA